MGRLGEALQSFWFAFPKLRERPPPQTKACACPHRPVLAHIDHMRRFWAGGREGGANNKIVSSARHGCTKFQVSSRSCSTIKSARPIDDMTRIDPGCFDATKPILDYSPVRVEITYRTINSLNVTGVIENFVHFPDGIIPGISGVIMYQIHLDK